MIKSHDLRMRDWVSPVQLNPWPDFTGKSTHTGGPFTHVDQPGAQVLRYSAHTSILLRSHYSKAPR